MIVVTKKAFLEEQGKDTLVGKMAQEFDYRWMPSTDLDRGYPVLDHDVSLFTVRS